MAKVRFEDGTVVNFEGDPTPEDIEEVANTLDIQKKHPGFIQGVAQSVAKPFLQAAATGLAIPKVLEAQKQGLPGITQEQAMIDAGYFGKAQPFETPGKAFLGGVEAGTTIPFGPGTIESIGGGLIKGTIKPSIKAGLKLAPLSAIGEYSRALQENTNQGEALTRAGVGAASTAIGAPLLGIAGAGVKGAGKFLTSPLKTTGALLEKAGSKIQDVVIRPTSRDVEDGFNISNVFKYGVGGNLGESFSKVESKIGDLTQKLYQRIGSAPTRINLYDIASKVENEFSTQKGKSFGEAGRINKLISELRDEIKLASPDGNVSIATAQEVKQAAGAKGAWEYGKPDRDSAASERVYNTFYSILKREIEKKSPPGVKEINKQLSDLIPIKNAIIRRIPIAERNQAISLTDTIALVSALNNPKTASLFAIQRLTRSGKIGNFLGKIGRRLQGKEDVAKIGNYIPQKIKGLLGPGPIIAGPKTVKSGIINGASDLLNLQQKLRQPLMNVRKVLPPGKGTPIIKQGSSVKADEIVEKFLGKRKK